MRSTGAAPERPARLLVDEIDSVVLDLDGTVYLGDAALPGAARAVAALRAAGKRIVFCSNNPTRHPDEYAAKLTRLGVPEPGLLDMIAGATGLVPATTVMVGDRLSTDIRFAHNTGMTGALVLTGETDRAMLADAPAADRPHVVLEHLDDLLTVPLTGPLSSGPLPAGPIPSSPGDGRP